MVGDGILDYFQELLLRVGGSYGQPMEQLDHESGKSLEGPGYPHGGTDLDENAFGSVDEDLKFARLVHG